MSFENAAKGARPRQRGGGGGGGGGDSESMTAAIQPPFASLDLGVEPEPDTELVSAESEAAGHGGAAASSRATPAALAELAPRHDFKMKPKPWSGGVLRWQHGENGFAFLLTETLKQMPADCFDKEKDWEPMITAVLKEVSEIIGPGDWPNELGFERFDTFSKEVLSSGLQAGYAPGVCIKSMKEYMREHSRRLRAFGRCTVEVGEKVDVVTEKLQKTQDLEELNRTIDDYEVADEGSIEQLEIAPGLRSLLRGFGYQDKYMDDPDSLRAAFEDFQDRSAVTASRIDDELQAARIALMRVLAKLAASTQDTLTTMEAMVPEVERHAVKIQADSVELCNILDAKVAEIRQQPVVSDDNQKWMVALDATKQATQQVAKCAQLMLVEHPRSLANNIKKDIEQTQDRGREHDTLHFDTFCTAWSKARADKIFAMVEMANIEARIKETKSDIVAARRGKNLEGHSQLTDRTRQLIEQKQRQRERTTLRRHHMDAMYNCGGTGEHKPTGDAQSCYCITPVLGRLARLQAGLCHPIGAHKPWYTLDSDDAFLARIMPHVTHNCSTHCYDAQNKLIQEMDGLTGQRGQPKHADGAVSLPPLDPRPELTRKVMRANEHIPGFVQAMQPKVTMMPGPLGWVIGDARVAILETVLVPEAKDVTALEASPRPSLTPPGPHELQHQEYMVSSSKPGGGSGLRTSHKAPVSPTGSKPEPELEPESEPELEPEPEPEPASGLKRMLSPHPRSAHNQDTVDEYSTCLDREFVQMEIGWAQQYKKKIIVVYEEKANRPGFFDFGKARKKYAGTKWEFILNIDAEPYQRDESYADGMINKIVMKAARLDKSVPPSEPINDPGSWDCFLSHAQAAGGDQTQTMSLRLKAKGWDVWYDNAMLDRSTAAMEEGVRRSRCFVLFLTGNGTAPAPAAAPAAPSTVPEDVPPQPLLDASRARINFSESIGTGGFADIFAGTYRFVGQSEHRVVAFKLFRDSRSLPGATKQRIQREAHIGLQLDHPHLVQFHGLLEIPRKGMALVQELATGGSLRTILSDADTFPVLSWPLRLRWLLGISEGVAKLHCLTPLPVIHRDIKAANVLLCGRELSTAVPKVCDFGVATLIQQTAGSTTTVDRGTAGTLAWKAPEVFCGKCSPASDVFSLAVTDFEIVTRQLPWDGVALEEVFEKVSERFDPTDRRVLNLLEKRGVSIEEQREDWIDLYPLDERRPDLAAAEVGCPPDLLDLTRRCWADDAGQRPPLRERLVAIRSIVAQVGEPPTAGQEHPIGPRLALGDLGDTREEALQSKIVELLGQLDQKDAALKQAVGRSEQ